MIQRKTLGERLVEARKAKGLKQYELAEKLGLTPTALNYYEKNKRRPDYDTLAKLSFELGHSVDYFLGLEAENAQRVREALQNENAQQLAHSLNLDADKIEFDEKTLTLDSYEVDYQKGDLASMPRYSEWSHILSKAAGQPESDKHQNDIYQLLQIIAGISGKDLIKLLDYAKEITK